MTHDDKLNALIEHTIHSCGNSLKFQSKLSTALNIESMLDARLKHLINNLSLLPNSHYLEVGAYRGGSALCAAQGKTSGAVTTFDDFSEFNDAQHGVSGEETALKKIIANINMIQPQTFFAFHNEDFFKSNLARFNFAPIDIYFYDGIHRFNTQYAAILKIIPYLNKYSVIIVDDWFCKISNTNIATYKALHDCRINIHFHTVLQPGHGIFVVEK